MQLYTPTEIMTMAGSQVSPLPQPALAKDCCYNILSFLPTETHWLAFLKCLADDNVEDLKIFAKHVDWLKFLQSCDVDEVWTHCSPDFARPASYVGSKHRCPSNPFFLAMFYNSLKCLSFMNESGIDFSHMTENGMTAYHLLMSAICFMTYRRCHGLAPVEFTPLVEHFHHSLFTREQQSFMMKTNCKYGMSPLSWGVYIGLADQVERILYYYSPNCVLHSKPVGMSEHVTMDVTECTGDNPAFFTSPICVLLDLYGESTLPELKRLGIFRNDFIWRQWVNLLYDRNKYVLFAYMAYAMLLTFFTVVYTGNSTNRYLQNKCANVTSEFPTGTIIILLSWLITSVVAELIVFMGVARKEYYRRKVGYPRWPRQYYRDLVGWMMPNTIAIPTSSFLLWIYLDAESCCNLFGSIIFTVAGLAHIVLLLASVCMIVCFLRLLPFLTTMMCSFYNSLGAFTSFVVFYLALMAIFARMFQSNFIFSEASNSTTSTTDTIPNFLSSFYTTFMVSLNIVDTVIFAPKEDRIDLSVTHMFYVLFVPILFINFMIGMLSSVVSQVLEHEVENSYILILEAVEFAERSFFPLNSLVRRIMKSRTAKVSICQPLSPESKLLVFCKSSLESLMQQQQSMDNGK